MSAYPEVVSPGVRSIRLSVRVRATAGLQRVQATIARSDGMRDTVTLTRMAGTETDGTWQGSFPIAGNPAVALPTCSVVFSALDTSGAVAETLPVSVKAASVVDANLPALTVSATHAGSFIQGQRNAAYLVTLSNAPGAGTTSAPVGVTDLLPVGMTLVAILGDGWTCQYGMCVRSDALPGGSSYPGIAVTVNVANNAPSPLSNIALVSGGSDPAPAECAVAGCPGFVEDVTTVDPNGPLNLSPAAVDFTTQTAPVTVTVANTGASPVHVSSAVVSGTFYGDYSIVHNCGTVQPASSCQVKVTFAAGGVGPRPATLLLVDDAINSPQAVRLNGSGTGTCGSVGKCAYPLLNSRVNANQTRFFVYDDSDSAFNHGFPSGLFGAIPLNQVELDSACVDDPASPTGCSVDPLRIDATRGTVFRFAFPKLGPADFVGVNFRDPADYEAENPTGSGYDLTPATLLQLDARSPGGVTVQFGVGGCVSQPYTLTPQWRTVLIPLSGLLPAAGDEEVACPPNLTDTHIVFTIATSQTLSKNAGTVLVDNVQFLPVPLRQTADPRALSLPLGNLTFGTPLQVGLTPDQANRTLAPIYEAAATTLALLNRGQDDDVRSALRIVDALHYALHHESSGAPLPKAPDGSQALHNAYSDGDIGLQNSQPGAGGSLAGEARLAGISRDKDTCPPGGFCLVLDGVTGGNNAWAMLAFIAAYVHTGNVAYLNDAKTIGNWIAGLLTDQQGFHGYFAGVFDSGPDKVSPFTGVIHGKSTENNGDIFAAFRMLAAIETTLA